MFLQRNKILFAIIILIGLLSGASAGGYVVLTRDLPQLNALESYRPSAVTRIYSQDRLPIAEFFLEKRDPVPISEIPAQLIAALLTVEDRAFYQHSGLALRGIARAVVRNLLSGRFSEGASTLTQQLAKTLFLTPRKTIVRKMREAILAIQLERRYTKREILELYLNQIYLGSGAYGVSAAARIYFGKSLSQLTLAENALLAGLPQSPSRYSPLVNLELSRKRRNMVLAEMKSTGIIDGTSYARAVDEEITLTSGISAPRSAPYFVDYIKESMEDAVGADLLYKGGLTVNTTLSLTLQAAAEKAIAEGLANLNARQPHPRYEPQAALIALDVTNGAVLAMVGGKNYHASAFNRAVSAARQPGSAFKPIVYALAIEKGWSQEHRLLDAPVVYPGGAPGAEDWQPANFSNSYEGEITLRWALMHSQNIPAVRLAEALGPSAVVSFAHAIGISSELNPDLSLALGTSETTLAELTSAYAVFANRGEYNAPFGVIEILGDDGNLLWRTQPQRRLAMSRAGAAIITDMLNAVIRSGTAQTAGTPSDSLAGKTGTSDDFRDAFFIGYSPAVVAGVWVGNDRNKPLGNRESGARAALPIWNAFMQAAQKERDQKYFDMPDDVEFRLIDPRDGSSRSEDDRHASKIMVRKKP